MAKVTMPGAEPEGLLSGVGEKSAQVMAGSLDRLTAVLREMAASPRRIEFQGFRGSFANGGFAFDGVVVIGPVKEG